MVRALSENLRGVDSLRTLTGLSFTDLISLGKTEGDTRRLPTLNAIPYGSQGIYTLWVSAPGVEPVLVYGGKCAAKNEGIRHRIRVELNPRQNELAASSRSARPQGPSRVYLHLHALGICPEWHAAIAIIKDVAAIDRIEHGMLAKIDFIANTQFNGGLRLEMLDDHFKSKPAPMAPRGAVIGAIPEARAPEPLPAENTCVEKPKKVKKVHISETASGVKVKKVKKCDLLAAALKAAETDPLIAKAAMTAVKLCRAKITSEITELQTSVDALLAQMDVKKALLEELC